jgi:hypothetical protein
MLLSTLNHNLPDLTDNIVEQLKRDVDFQNHQMIVIDNGSKENLAKHTTHQIEENIFFGGGFNVIMDYFLNQTNEDYLVVFNNDLIFHGYNILTNMLTEMKENDLAVYSPSIINADMSQCHWKQMYNWGTNSVRQVKWIDFQCPILRRDVCEIIKEYPQELIYGWGLDFYTGLITEKNNLKTGVSDNVTICHLNSQTFKQDKINIGVEDFCQKAEMGMHNYFSRQSDYQDYIDLRTYGENYKYE